MYKREKILLTFFYTNEKNKSFFFNDKSSDTENIFI